MMRLKTYPPVHNISRWIVRTSLRTTLTQQTEMTSQMIQTKRKQNTDRMTQSESSKSIMTSQSVQRHDSQKHFMMKTRTHIPMSLHLHQVKESFLKISFTVKTGMPWLFQWSILMANSTYTIQDKWDSLISTISFKDSGTWTQDSEMIPAIYSQQSPT